MYEWIKKKRERKREQSRMLSKVVMMFGLYMRVGANKKEMKKMEKK